MQRRSSSYVVSFASLFIVPAAALVPACAGKHTTTTAAPSDAGHLDETYKPDASCEVAIDTPPLLAGVHVAIGSTIVWSSNPPSSGPHYPIWAAYQTFTTPVDLGYLVHNLEHGAIVLLYKCDDPAGCPDIVAQLEQVVASLPDDPLCASQTGGAVRVRAVISPDPLLDVPIAAAAWGWTYKAACVDLPTLEDFAHAHYGQGPEQICSNGQTQF